MRRYAHLMCLAAIVALSAGFAEGAMHLRLTKSAPAKDGLVAEAPAEIRLWFSQTPELAVSRIRVTAADGSEVELGEVEAGDEDTLVAAVMGPMPSGIYEVSWRTSSGDGHPITGTFGFTVDATD